MNAKSNKPTVTQVTQLDPSYTWIGIKRVGLNEVSIVEVNPETMQETKLKQDIYSVCRAFVADLLYKISYQ